MAIRRAKRDSNFTMISNVGLKDNRLSFKAKGLLSYMLSLPDDWIFYESEIVNHATDGKQSVRTGMKELEKFGYLVKEQKRNSKGKFAKIDWVVSDEPINGDTTTFQPSTTFPSTDNPSTDKRATDNRTLLSTNELSTNKPSTNNKEHTSAKLTERFEGLWEMYPRKQGKKDALRHYKRAIKEGTTDDEIKEGIQSYVDYIKNNNIDKRYVKHGSAWFNQEGWLDDYEINFEDDESVDDLAEDIFSMLEE